MNDVRMNVWKVLYDSTIGSSVVLLRNDSESRILPIWIGQSEALSIAIALENIQMNRPMTHDLMIKFMELVELDLEWIRISDIKDGTFFAAMRLHNKERDHRIDMDSRPSDAIALAVRVGVPIFVSEKVLMEALRTDVASVNNLDDLEEDFLENLPEEIFGKYKM